MNWTGGRLQRHSRNSAGKSLNYAQKQHFAKVRSRLQNGPRAVSSLDFSLLHAARDAGKGRGSERDDSVSESRPKRQKTLSEYATTAALANRLNAMKPRQASHGRGTSSELRFGAKRPEPGDAFARHGVPAGYRTSSDSDASARYLTEDRSNHGHEVGLRSKPESSRRNLFPTTFVSNKSATKPESLEDKRQSLLQQDNWVCAAVTRPLKINFPGSNDRQKVGRRRRISTEERSRHILPVPRRFRPSIQGGLLPEGSDWDDRGGREDISIRIGGQVHGSQRTTLRGVEELLSQSQHHSLSSESMLLDKEDTWYGAQGAVDLSPRTSLLGAHNQRLVHEDALWQSRTDAALLSVLSGTPGAMVDECRRKDELQPYLYQRLEDEEEQGYNDFTHSNDLYSDTERSEASHKSSVQSLVHHHQPDIAEGHSTKKTDGVISTKRRDPLAPRIPAASPLRLIFDSTPQTTTSQLSDFGAVSVQNTQAIRSTVVEASDDTKDAVVKDSDEIEWEKLVMLNNTNTHSKLLLSEASISNEHTGSYQATSHVVTAQAPGIDRTGGSKPNLRLAANDRRVIAPVDKMPDKGIASLQTEDEIWMKFLDISGHAEEEDQEDKTMSGRQTLKRFESSDASELPLADRRLDNESILAQASSTSFTRTIVGSPSVSSTNFASDRAHSHIEGPMKQTSSLSSHSPIRSTVATVDTSPAPVATDAYISTAATVHASSPDPLEASKSTAPSMAAATVHSSSSGLLLPSTSVAPPQSHMRLPLPSQVSSPDPLTLTSPSAHVGLHKDGQAATIQPPRRQRVLFTKPTPFTGRQVSATTIHKASREPLRFGRTIADSSLKLKSALKDAKGTPRTGMRRGKDKGRGAGRAAARSIYSIPSTDSDIDDSFVEEDATESIEDDNIDLLEQI